MERLVDAIMSPCHHGGVCFKLHLHSFGQSQFVLLLQRRTHCIIKNVFKVYQVKPASNNLGYYRVVNAYFIYDHREEHVYQQYANELEAMEAEARLSEEIVDVEGNSQHASSVQGNIRLPNRNVESISLREWDVRSRAPQIMIDPLPEQAFSS
jgi:hypothetical protein